VRLYAGTTEQFVHDAMQHRIADKLAVEYKAEMGHKAGAGEYASWQNSLTNLGWLVDHAKLHDHGIILEYQLPLSSLRLDAMLTGRSASAARNAVIIELKQWGVVQPSTVPECVETFIAHNIRRVLHPSVQVGRYQQYLLDTHTAFYEGGIGLSAVSYVHNMNFHATDELFAKRHAAYLASNPLFTGDRTDELAEFLNERLSAGEGIPIMAEVLDSQYRPSKKLLEHTAAMVKGQTEFVLLDEQLVVFNSVLQAARESFHETKKGVMLVKGGPGTGKSVIALNLVGELANQGYNAQHATGSKAFTENLRRVVGPRASSQFKYFNSYGPAASNDIDVLILDEAHRLRETSANRYTSKAKRTELAQVDELIRAAKVSVFFIDDLQAVRPNEVGSTELIVKAAHNNGAELDVFELATQFRCAGSDAFVSWVDNTLGLAETANPTWDGTEGFDFRVVDSVEQLDSLIRSKADEGFSARLTAGFCWRWSDPEPDGTLVNDVKIGTWEMPWNARPEATRLATNIPPSNFWASSPNGINQVGCVYTAQGFEFDYVGVIVGRDLRWDPTSDSWIGDPSESHDSIVKRGPRDRFSDLVKRTYRVLFTRGIKGCYLYFMDPDTGEHVHSGIGSALHSSKST
jgi:DUF2075 family protein/Mrp family chromosome partitioning ATPase